MHNTIALLGCSNIHELSELAISDFSVIEDIERGYLSEHKNQNHYWEGGKEN